MTRRTAVKKPDRNAAIALTVVAFLLLIPMMRQGVVGILDVGLMFALAWYGWANTPDGAPASAREEAPPPAEQLVPASDAAERVDNDIRLARRLTASAEVHAALDRFRATLDGIAGQHFNDENAAELDVMVERNFPVLMSRYISARRQSADRLEDETDRILVEAVSRLTAGMSEIRARQRRIDADLLREHGDYLRERHPIGDDPFSANGSERS